METAETTTTAATPNAQTMRLVHVPLEEFVDEGDFREERSPERVTTMADSIRANGLLVPLRAEEIDNRKHLIDGRCRLAALKLLGKPTALTQVVTRSGTPVQRCREDLVSNSQRENLSPWEQAQALRNLKQLTGATSAQLARETGFSESKVSRLLAIADWPAELQALLRRNEITVGVGAELAKQSAETRTQSLAQTDDSTLTRDALAGSRKQLQRGEGAVGSPKIHAKAHLGADRMVNVSAPDLDLESLISLLQELLDKARKARTKGLTLSTFVKLLRDTARAAK